MIIFILPGSHFGKQRIGNMVVVNFMFKLKKVGECLCVPFLSPTKVECDEM